MAEEENAPKASFRQKLGLIAYKALCAVLRVTDIRLVAVIGRCMGYLTWALSPSRRAIVARNLRIILDPTLRPDKLSAMVRRNMVRTSMNLACSLKTGLMTDRELNRAAVIHGKEIMEKHASDGHTAVCCIPHAGNWELLARIRPLCDKVKRFGSMYRRLRNPLLEQFVYKSRTGYGCEMYSKENGLKAVLQFAKTGGGLGVLCDQFTQEGLFLPYFGKMTGVTPLPAILHKRCKGKATLLAVFTRNVAIGKWEVELGNPIELPENCDSMAEVTMQVNLALEKSQSDNIMDGFWMHHRWKAHAEFALEQTPELLEIASRHVKLPFRIIFAMPEAFDEAVYLLPVLRALKASRFDAQLTVLCPEEQVGFWRKMQDCVSYVVPTDRKESVLVQLESDEMYKDGPYDYLFMFSENKRVMRDLQKLKPIFVSGFEDNPLRKKYRFIRVLHKNHDGAPRHIREEYLACMARFHRVGVEDAAFTATMQGNETCTDTFIAPFSTLGKADAWTNDKWAELVRRLRDKGVVVRLLHLPQDAEKAKTMAVSMGIDCCEVAPEDVAQVLGSKSRLYAVDGLLPQLAAWVNCPCTVLMASRLAARYAPLGEGHRVLTNHVACHPCYRTACDAAAGCCTQGISVDEMLGTEA